MRGGGETPAPSSKTLMLPSGNTAPSRIGLHGHALEKSIMDNKSKGLCLNDDTVANPHGKRVRDAERGNEFLTYSTGKMVDCKNSRSVWEVNDNEIMYKEMRSFQPRKDNPRVKEVECGADADYWKKQSQFRPDFEAKGMIVKDSMKTGFKRIHRVVMKQAQSRHEIDVGRNDRRIRSYVEEEATSGEKKFKGRSGDMRSRRYVTVRAFEGMDRRFQLGRQIQKQSYNEVEHGSRGKKAALGRPLFSSEEASGTGTVPVGSLARPLRSEDKSENKRRVESYRPLGLEDGGGSQMRAESAKQLQLQGRSSSGSSRRVHRRAVNQCFTRPRCRVSFKPSATKVVDSKVRSSEEESLAPKIGLLRGRDSRKIESSEDGTERERVEKTLSLFRRCRKCILEEAKSDKTFVAKRVDARVYEMLKERNSFANTGEPIIGNIPGVAVGCRFRYRLELCAVGMHRRPINGIDYIKGKRPMATSIVSTGVYNDTIYNLDVIIYTGEGGRCKDEMLMSKDQELIKGNLALKNSVLSGSPVRLIRGIRKPRGKGRTKRKANKVSVYIYYGLYTVERYWSERGVEGFLEYKFLLRRMPDQPCVDLTDDQIFTQR